jgi:hypothetical protein
MVGMRRGGSLHHSAIDDNAGSVAEPTAGSPDLSALAGPGRKLADSADALGGRPRACRRSGSQGRSRGWGLRRRGGGRGERGHWRRGACGRGRRSALGEPPRLRCRLHCSRRRGSTFGEPDNWRGGRGRSRQELPRRVTEDLLRDCDRSDVSGSRRRLGRLAGQPHELPVSFEQLPALFQSGSETDIPATFARRA